MEVSGLQASCVNLSLSIAQNFFIMNVVFNSMRSNIAGSAIFCTKKSSSIQIIGSLFYNCSVDSGIFQSSIAGAIYVNCDSIVYLSKCCADSCYAIYIGMFAQFIDISSNSKFNLVSVQRCSPNFEGTFHPITFSSTSLSIKNINSSLNNLLGDAGGFVTISNHTIISFCTISGTDSTIALYVQSGKSDCIYMNIINNKQRGSVFGLILFRSDTSFDKVVIRGNAYARTFITDSSSSLVFIECYLDVLLGSTNGVVSSNLIITSNIETYNILHYGSALCFGDGYAFTKPTTKRVSFNFVVMQCLLI